MAAILLGMAGLNSLDANPQSEPPDRELAQLEQGVGGSEGNTVSAADVGGQAALLKQPLKHGKSAVFFGVREGLRGKQITAGVLDDGHRLLKMRRLSGPPVRAASFPSACPVAQNRF